MVPIQSNSYSSLFPEGGLRSWSQARQGDAAIQVETEKFTSAGKGETILLVDDEASVRKTTAEVLQSLGCKVLAAKKGQEAVQVLRSNLER